MGIIRNPLKCLSCGAVTVTRTATGLFPPYNLKFPCPGCGVEIRYTMKGDKTRTRYSFTTPVNGRWVKSEEGSVATLTFDPDRVAPRDMTNVFSPFLADVFRFSTASREAHAKEEGMRRAWRTSHWPWIQRLTVHFDNRNATLFDKEAKLTHDTPDAASWATRLRLLHKVLAGAFDSFTLNTRAAVNRVLQRVALAQSVSPGLFDEFVQQYHASGRMLTTWQDLQRIRTAFLANYLTISPVLATRYWSKPPVTLAEFSLPDKQFDQLRQLYVDCFELLCRLTVIAIAQEAIIHYRALSLPSRKQLSIWDYEAIPNGNKHTHLAKFPIHDLFIPFMNHKLRNGLGHYAAAYDSASDEVVYYKQEGHKLQKTRLAYTDFAFAVLEIYSVVELAAYYYHSVHIRQLELGQE